MTHPSFDERTQAAILIDNEFGCTMEPDELSKARHIDNLTRRWGEPDEVVKGHSFIGYHWHAHSQNAANFKRAGKYFSAIAFSDENVFYG